MLNRLFVSRCEALAAPAADLHFRMCDDSSGCGFVWNAAFDPDSVAYAPGYINDQSRSPTFRAHLDQVRIRLATLGKDRTGDMLEIGCGQGDFLRSLCETTGRGGVGFDPAFVGETPPAPAIVFRSRFDEQIAQDASAGYSLVCCRHVLEHLHEPRDILRSIASLFSRHSRSARLYIEVPCFDWIAQQAAFFDLFNEHCSLFTARSLRRLLAACGFATNRIEQAFDGQYLAAEASLEQAPHLPTIDANDDDRVVFSEPDQFAVARDMLHDEINDQLRSRPTALWGAGAKGVSLVNHIGINADRMPFIVDINPAKHHRFVPITGQEVIAPHELHRLETNGRSPLVYVMNPNYASEIRRQLLESGVTAEVRVLDGRPRVALHR